MDTFLMAMGEAMASGAIPIATAQRGMRHFEHEFDIDQPWATGLAVPRSFRVDDPLLTDAVYAGLRRMVHLVRTDPARIRALRVGAIEVGRRFTWSGVARRFLAVFEACLAEGKPAEVQRIIRPWLTGNVPPLIPDVGHGNAERSGDRIQVSWSNADAASVEIVLADDPVEVLALERCGDGSFTGIAPPRQDDSLAMLVTRRDGRSTWAEVPIDQAAIRMRHRTGCNEE
jgi:hypothetical protein